MSHEILEMVADPGANLYAAGFVRDRADRKRGALVSYEVCDPVESITYKIAGVPVSNFVLPEWFEPEHEDGSLKMDYRGRLNGPFQLAPGGYVDYLRDGKLRTIWGVNTRRKKARHRFARRVAICGGY